MNGDEVSELTNKLSELALNVALLSQEMKKYGEMAEALKKVVCGNGEIGLDERTRNLEKWQDRWSKVLVFFGTAICIEILGALAAIILKYVFNI